jgi:hypothetical protein
VRAPAAPNACMLPARMASQRCPPSRCQVGSGSPSCTSAPPLAQVLRRATAATSPTAACQSAWRTPRRAAPPRRARPSRPSCAPSTWPSRRRSSASRWPPRTRRPRSGRSSWRWRRGRCSSAAPSCRWGRRRGGGGAGRHRAAGAAPRGS